MELKTATFLSVLLLVVRGDDYEGTAVLPLQHSFETGKDAHFEPRGSITIRSVRSNVASLYSPSVTQDFRNSLKKEAKAGGIYRIRVPTKLGSDEFGNSFVSGFIPACSLYESALSDEISIHVEPNSGDVLALSLRTFPSTCRNIDVPDKAITQFNTSVEIEHTVAGPQPETQAYLEKLQRDKVEKEKGDTEDNRSFLAKYWMYIVPVVIFLMISSAANPDGGGGR